MAKPGRKRRQGVREPSGRIQRGKRTTTRETPEIALRRAVATAGGNPERAHYPLGALAESGIISHEQRLAGERLAWLRWLAHGKALSMAATRYGEWIASSGAEPEPNRVYTDEEMVERKNELHQAMRTWPTRAMRDAVENVCVFEHFPDYAWPMKHTLATIAAQQRLQDGLTLLERYFRTGLTGLAKV